MSTLDQFKEEWKKQPSENFSTTNKTHTAMLTLLNSRTKENVRKKTGGLLGITMAASVSIHGVGWVQDKINHPWVDALCWFIVPSLMVLCVTAAILYFRLNRHKLSKMNTMAYLGYLLAQLQRTESLVKNIVFPLVPVAFVPAMLFIVHFSGAGSETVKIVVGGYLIFFVTWLMFGFIFFFNWLMNKHDYHTLRKEVEVSLLEL